MKATKAIYAVPEGEIYPIKLEKGDEIPDNMLKVADKLGATAKKKAASSK